MGTITSGVGLISGLNTSDIIDQLMAIEGRKKTLVQARVEAIATQKTAFTDVSTRLTSLRLTAQSIAKPSFFSAATATSSDENVLTATAAKGAAVGTYQFQVARLVQSQQLVSKGFGDHDKTAVGAGTLTIEMGGGEITQENQLADLNGGKGISRGAVRITDMAGKQAVIDLSDAVTLDDVTKKINTTVDINVEAKVVNDRLVLTDKSNGFDSDLVVQDVGTTTTATDLGIAGTNVLGQITGTVLQYVGRDTKLATLNDGNGVANKVGTDFKITYRDGTFTDIDIGAAVTMGDVIDAINTAAGTKLTAQTVAGGKGIELVDNTGGGGTLAVTAIGNSMAAADLGLTATASGNTLTGDAVLSKLGTVMMKTLNGGAGITLGTISVTNRNGSPTSIDLSGAKTVQTALDLINNAGAGVKAEINGSGNGIQITDTSGGTGNLIISDVSGTGAEQLGLVGTFGMGTPVVKGANLQRKWMSESKSLASLNGGKGITAGRFKVTAADGVSKTINIDPTVDLTVGNVLQKINASFGGKVVASINTQGDGLLLTDASGGASKLKVEDDNGKTAKDLGIAGTAKDLTIDGSFERTVTIDADDKLGDVQTKINAISYGVTAQIINDGSGAAPYRLSLNTTNSGLAGRVTFDAGTTKIDARTLVKAQDAAVFVGSADAAQPLLVTASRNQISGVVKGVSIDLHSVGKEPVTVSISRDVANVGEEMTKFVEKFNELVDKMAEYTKFDTDTMQRGVLMGDSSITQVQTELYAMMNTVVPQAGKYRILADVGVRIGEGGHIEFDEDKFNAAYADDPESVEELFTNTGSAVSSSTRLDLLNKGTGVQTAGAGQTDFTAKLKDGTSVDVTVGDVGTLGELIARINDAAPQKLKAELTDDFKVKITDLTTTGTDTLKLEQKNGSQVMFDLGLTGDAVDGAVVGKLLKVDNALQSVTGGIGISWQQKLNKLIDPVDGVITRQNKTLDNRTDDFKDRIEQIDAQLAAKKLRLQKQFIGLESVLGQLQTQQQSLGNIKPITTND